jgi:hypothetical protein
MSEDRPVDVNERVTEAWKTDTGPGERVRTVMKRTYDPQPVATIAGRALTSETTARKHLTVLAEDGFVEAVSPPDQRRTWYKRAPRSVVLERAQQMLDAVDIETLSARVTKLRETVREFDDPVSPGELRLQMEDGIGNQHRGVPRPRSLPQFAEGCEARRGLSVNTQLPRSTPILASEPNERLSKWLEIS